MTIFLFIQTGVNSTSMMFLRSVAFFAVSHVDRSSAARSLRWQLACITPRDAGAESLGKDISA